MITHWYFNGFGPDTLYSSSISVLLIAVYNNLPIRDFKKRTVYSGFKDNIWGADLADTQLISKFNKGLRFLLCVIDIFS